MKDPRSSCTFSAKQISDFALHPKEMAFVQRRETKQHVLICPQCEEAVYAIQLSGTPMDEADDGQQ